MEPNTESGAAKSEAVALELKPTGVVFIEGVEADLSEDPSDELTLRWNSKGEASIEHRASVQLTPDDVEAIVIAIELALSRPLGDRYLEENREHWQILHDKMFAGGQARPVTLPQRRPSEPAPAGVNRGGVEDEQVELILDKLKTI